MTTLGVKTDVDAALDVGQLIKDEYFTLFESIGAIEVGSLFSVSQLRRSCNKDHGPQDG